MSYCIPDAPYIRWCERTGYDQYNQPDPYEEELDEEEQQYYDELYDKEMNADVQI